MKNFMEISSVVDSVRSNAGSAFKSVQKTFEEQALKAAGLGEDEESLYLLNKRVQSYLRAVDAMQQAANGLVDDFASALEDIALRDIARKLRDSNKATATQQMASLQRELAVPIKQACEGDNYATRRKLVNKAFTSFLGVNFDCMRAASESTEEARTSAEAALKALEKSPARDEKVSPPPETKRSTPPAPVRKDSGTPARHASTPAGWSAVAASAPTMVPDAAPKPVALEASFADLLGDTDGNASSKAPAATGSSGSVDLLDFDFGAPSVTSNVSNSGTGVHAPPQRSQTVPSFSSVPFDLDFNSVLNSGTSAPPERVENNRPSPPAKTSFSGLEGMSWPSKEDEDESCIRARVETWQQGKNLRTMLVSLHEVAPASADWKPVQLCEVVQPSDVKSVYRKAVLSVHPDKHQCGKSGEKVLGHLVFQALCDQWNVYKTSG